MAIVQRPLGAPIALASEHLRSAADLVGQDGRDHRACRPISPRSTPSSPTPAANPAKVKVVTIGFDGVAYLEAGKIAAFTGYWPDDGGQPAGQRPSDHRLQARPERRPRLPRARRLHDALADRARPVARARRSCARRCTATRTRCATRRAASPSCWPRNPSIEPKLARASLAAYLPIFDAGGVPVRDARARRGSRRCRAGWWRNRLIAQAGRAWRGSAPTRSCREARRVRAREAVRRGRRGARRRLDRAGARASSCRSSGPSGCGKSTLLAMLAGPARADARAGSRSTGASPPAGCSGGSATCPSATC